ncbi:hypothetical protein TrRE_jg6445 [Triparma retinervis]|uniref:PPM-type phosphatase domain-containing protein n=1 Tax=Triparma retinervis TaxID=2557542 RepID=A0A9W7G406_9STRA|nr:hypothetical protein TrRE_jg6445 [Triparma retinervis]
MSLRSSLISLAVLFSTSLPENTFASPGATANVVLSCSSLLYCGNVGDSASHSFPPTSSPDGEKMSIDHDTWVREDEEERLSKAGAFLHPSPPPFKLASFAPVKILYTLAFGCPRVYKADARGNVVGGLNMTRSIGDVQLKPQVSHDPDVTLKECEVGEFVVTATDGVWDELSPAEVGALIKAAEQSTQKNHVDLPPCEGVARAASLIVNEAIKRGGRDNATAIVAKRCQLRSSPTR